MFALVRVLLFSTATNDWLRKRQRATESDRQGEIERVNEMSDGVSFLHCVMAQLYIYACIGCVTIIHAVDFIWAILWVDAGCNCSDTHNKNIYIHNKIILLQIVQQRVFECIPTKFPTFSGTFGASQVNRILN